MLRSKPKWTSTTAVTVTFTALIVVAVLLTWRYAHRCDAWEAKVDEQIDEMFRPAFADAYTSEGIEALARRALDHERPEGC